MDQKRVDDILMKHKKWLNGEEGGERLNVNHINLTEANLHNADLRKAVLCYAKLTCADLRGADLREATFCYADFSFALLDMANLMNTDLFGAKFYNSTMMKTDFSNANMTLVEINNCHMFNAVLNDTVVDCIIVERTNLNYVYMNDRTYSDLCKSVPLACPDAGEFIGWKKARCHYGNSVVVRDCLLKLLIPEGAKRSSGTGRKCRADKAICLSIEPIYHNFTQGEVNEAVSQNDDEFIYTVGKMAEVENFDENRFHECAPGIHFFITREEALRY